MRKEHGYNYWKKSTEKLKEKWTTFTERIIYVIADEEMKIRREKLDMQIGTRLVRSIRPSSRASNTLNQ